MFDGFDTPEVRDTQKAKTALDPNSIMDYAQLSKQTGVSPGLLRRLSGAGIIKRINPDAPRSVRALFDFRAAVPAIIEYKKSRKTGGPNYKAWAAEILIEGQKRCNACGKPCFLDQFPICSESPIGRRGTCNNCIAPMRRLSTIKRREIDTKRKTAYRKRIKETDPAKYERMEEARRDSFQRNNAVNYGKTGPFTKRAGFALVQNERTGEWLPRRADKPLEPEDRAVALFSPFEERGKTLWNVEPAPYTKERDKHILAAQIRKENANNARIRAGKADRKGR